MNTDPGRRWPFGTAEQSFTGMVPESDDDAATAVVTAAAAALDADPLVLPQLYDRVDPDCLDTLLDGAGGDPSTGIRVAVEVRLKDADVLVRDDGYVEVYLEGTGAVPREPDASVEHDWSSTRPLPWRIAEAVAAVSGEDRTEVGRRLVDHLDGDALDGLLRPRTDGSEREGGRLHLSVEGYEVSVGTDATVDVEPSLAALKRAGATVLVVGSIPEQGFDRAAATLLGDPGETRAPVFVHHGQDLTTASRRLATAGMAPSTATVVEHRAPARAASGTATADTSPRDRPELVPVAGEVRELPDEVRESIATAEPFAPGEFRLCVDSLSSMRDSSGLGTTTEAVEGLCELVRDRRGVGAFMLPVDADRDAVDALAPAFDAVVELRARDDDVEQRWRLNGTGHRTSWFPLV